MCRISLNIDFTALCQWSNYHVFAIITDQFGRHRFQLAVEKHVKKHGFDDIIPMVTQSNFIRPDLIGKIIENTASQS